MRIAASLAPRSQALWMKAMEAELVYCERVGDQVVWALNCMGAALVFRALEKQTIFLTIATATAVLAICLDWSTRTDAPALALIATASAAIAYWLPERAMVASLIIGGAPLLAHTLSNFSGLYWPNYQFRVLAPTDFLILISVIIGAYACASGAAWVRRLQLAINQTNRNPA